ncbi:MAG: hypothetical protein JXA95_01060 [Spirochaetales bacterium]|nr:hypothetical protein [Spirochaetales bacterium]
MKRRFYFYNRGVNKTWYVAILNPETGERLPARSTGTSDREKAEYLANKWYYEGVPEEKTADPRSVKELCSVDKILSDLKTVTLQNSDVHRFLRYFKDEGFINYVP